MKRFRGSQAAVAIVCVCVVHSNKRQILLYYVFFLDFFLFTASNMSLFFSSLSSFITVCVSVFVCVWFDSIVKRIGITVVRKFVLHAHAHMSVIF